MIWHFQLSQTICQADNCSPDLGSTTWQELSFSLLQRSRTHPSLLSDNKKVGRSKNYHNTEPFKSQWRLQIWLLALHTMNNRPALSFQSRIDFLLASEQKHGAWQDAWDRASSPALDGTFSPGIVKFVHLFISINKLSLAVNKMHAWSRQNKSHLDLSRDFWLRGCCSYLLFSPLQTEPLLVTTGKAWGERGEQL